MLSEESIYTSQFTMAKQDVLNIPNVFPVVILGVLREIPPYVYHER